MRNILRHPRFTHRPQAGDTIVEVLICIAVISAILTGAFVVSNHSSQSVRDSEEHAQALQYLQGQIEQLRADVATKNYSSLQSAFCYQASGVYTIPITDPGCTQGTFYALQIQKIAGPAGGINPVPMATFMAQVKWDSISGGTDQEQLYYRTQVAGP